MTALERAALLTITDVTRLVKMGKTWVYAEIKAGRFPAQLRLSHKSARWRAGDVLDYLAALAAPSQGSKQ